MFLKAGKILFWPMLGFLVCLFFPFSAKAVGLSPPQALLGQVEADETHMIYMRLQRETDEVGQINFTVEPGGDQSENFVGDTSFVIQASEDAYNYYFAFTPDEVETTGDFTLYVRFYYTVVGDSVSEPDAVGSSVDHGVTGTVTYSMTGTVEDEDDDDNGGGGGGGRPPRIDDDEESVEEEEDVVEDDDVDDVEETEESEPLSEPTEEPLVEQESGSESEPESEYEEENNFDLNDDGEVEEEDIKEFFDCFVRGESQCDFDRDGDFDVRDLSLLVSSWTGGNDFDTGQSPFAVGPPLDEDVIIFKFQVAEQDAWRFHAILSGDSLSDDDMVSVYVLVDTGPDGVNAADLEFSYNTEKFKFFNANLLGTIFPIFLPEPQEILPGVIKIMAATPVGFIGTNGLVARLDFEVLTDGEADLSFINLAAYEPGGIAPEQVQGIDFLGILEKEENKFLAAPTTEVGGTVDCLTWSDVFARFRLWIIWWLLFLALLTDLFAIFYCYNYFLKNKRKKYDKETLE